MKPVDQTLFGSPGGNCLPACVASLLNLTIEDVPHFGAEDWFDRLNDWLAPRGYYAMCFTLPTEWRPPGLYILAGKSPRFTTLHAVVARGNEVIHDPHPSRAGVDSHTDATILVRMDPVADGGPQHQRLPASAT